MPWVVKTAYSQKGHVPEIDNKEGVFSLCGRGPLIHVGPEFVDEGHCKQCMDIEDKRGVRIEAKGSPMMKVNEAIIHMRKQNARRVKSPKCLDVWLFVIGAWIVLYSTFRIMHS